MDRVLTQVRDFADRAHGNQTRRYSADRYIVHPVRVMEICRQHTNDLALLAAAILHDVLEDTEVRKNEMEDFLKEIMEPTAAQRTLQFVIELTDIYVKNNYPQWNRRKRKSKEADRLEKVSAEAQTIKYADIIDNSGEIASHDPDFAKLYLDEATVLLSKMTKGNRQLRERALETVKAEKEMLQ
jgi:guanosine-3',5'-bis(diphosphate) 3'-pyrophosphohydrolase